MGDRQTNYENMNEEFFRMEAGKKKRVKCTPVQAPRLCTGRTAHRGSTGIALPFHDHGTRRGWGVSVTPQLLFTTGKDSVPIVQEAGSGQLRKILPQSGFNPRTVQPVASRYTDWAIRPTWRQEVPPKHGHFSIKLPLRHTRGCNLNLRLTEDTNTNTECVQETSCP